MNPQMMAVLGTAIWFLDDEDCNVAGLVVPSPDDVLATARIVEKVVEAVRNAPTQDNIAEAEALAERIRAVLRGGGALRIAMALVRVVECMRDTRGLRYTLWSVGSWLSTMGDPWLTQLGETFMRLAIQPALDIEAVKRYAIWGLARLVHAVREG